MTNESLVIIQPVGVGVNLGGTPIASQPFPLGPQIRIHLLFYYFILASTLFACNAQRGALYR